MVVHFDTNLVGTFISKVATPVLYYSGHGEKGTGNWCFKNGCVSPQDVERIHGSVAGCRYPMIISDSCYSGFWADYLSLKKGYHCLAASPYHSVAYDTSTIRAFFKKNTLC